MRIHDRLVANGKFPGITNGIKEFQDRAVPAYIESHKLDKEFTTVFDFKSLQEWHNICIDKSYFNKPMAPVDDIQIFYKQLKKFCNNAVPLSSKNFEDRLLSIPVYDLNSQAIQAIRISLFHLEFFAKSIQVASSTTQNTNDFNISPEGFVIDSTLEMKLSSDKNTRRSSNRHLNFFSNVYKQIKTIGFNQIDKTKMKSDSSNQNLLKLTNEENTDENIIRRNLIVKIDVNNNWALLERVLRYSMVREIPVVVVFNLKLDEDQSENLGDFLFVKRLPFLCHFANINNRVSSNLLIFYMAQPNLNFNLTRSQRHEPSLNERNNFMMVDVDFNQSRFQLITVYGTKMSEENEQRLYLRLNRIINNNPTILIVQSPNGRFHRTCADGDLDLELANDDLLNQLENTDGTLIYISREFPEDIRNIRVFTGDMRYRRNGHEGAHLEACIIVMSIPLNQ